MWEYKTIKIDLKGLFSPSFENEPDLNQYGRDGWELVSAFPLATGYGRTVSAVFVFKRMRK